MDFQTIYNILEESNLTRQVLGMKRSYSDAVSYVDTTNSTNISVNDVDYSEVSKICLVHDETDIFVYLNYNNRFKVVKWKLSDVTDFSIS